MGKVPWHSGFGLTASEHWRHTKNSFDLKVFANSSTMAGVGNIECAYALETAALHTSPREFFLIHILLLRWPLLLFNIVCDFTIECYCMRARP